MNRKKNFAKNGKTMDYGYKRDIIYYLNFTFIKEMKLIIPSLHNNTVNLARKRVILAYYESWTSEHSSHRK